ncbi:DUF1259 domain-containing protein [Planococcus salinus]|nr:DUF1259 domain-containing protein [Planococcus salinus]
MEAAKLVVDTVSDLMNASVESEKEKYVIRKSREIEIHEKTVCFNCKLELDISFEFLEEDGLAFNKAEILLLPEEFPIFSLSLREHHVPFPSVFRQWQVVNPNIIGIYLESIEPPENFAARLSGALNVLEQM